MTVRMGNAHLSGRLGPRVVQVMDDGAGLGHLGLCLMEKSHYLSLRAEMKRSGI